MKNLIFLLCLLLFNSNVYSQSVDEVVDKLNVEKDYSSAIEDLNILISDDSENYYLYYLRAYAFRNLKNFYKAKKDYAKADELIGDPAYTPEIYRELASVFYSEKDYKQAASNWKKFLEYGDEDDISTHYNVALSYYNLNDFSNSIEYFSNVISMNTSSEFTALSHKFRGRAKNKISDRSGCDDVYAGVRQMVRALNNNEQWAIRLKYQTDIDYLYNSYCATKKDYKFWFKQWKKGL